MINFNEETLAKAKQAKSVEELLTLAKESDIDMTAEQAQEIFARLNQKSGELSDDELDNVAGGGCYNGEGNLIVSSSHMCDLWTCKTCGGIVIEHVGVRHGHSFCANCHTGIGCSNCRYCFRQNGLTLCTNPRYKK